MDPVRLKLVAQTLFPVEDWKQRLAQALDVSLKRVDRWLAAKRRDHSGRFLGGAPKAVEVALECMLQTAVENGNASK